MRQILAVFILLVLVSACKRGSQTDEQKFITVCNPVNISYRFCLDSPSRREAADPTVIRYKDGYLLFASKSGGYWYSANLADWRLIETNQLPTEEYAPTVVAIHDTLYFLASSNEKSTIYKTTDPMTGNWGIAVEELEIPVWDPAFFLDDDGRLYLYWGCSDKNPIYGVEIDYHNNFAFLGKPVELFNSNTKVNGWEVPGDYNTLVNQSPWIEGAWMNKLNGRYYLQYAGPGTEFKSYADGVYIADNPLGPFRIQEHNPFSYRPDGFAAGAGHGSTFADMYGNLWHIGTITISQKHMFERRLGLYPTFCDENGTLHTVTKYGDYPFIVPQNKISSVEELFPGWMLLSYNKRVEVSSEIDSFSARNLVDENIRTYWAAKTGSAEEYAMLDLGKSCDVYAIQVNFAEHNTELYGRVKELYHQFIIEYSNDGKNWKLMIDKSKNQSDNSHDYTQLPAKLLCRYLKIKDGKVPSGNFALSGFRVFGNGMGENPQKNGKLEAIRNTADRRSVALSWDKTKNTTGYTISFGVDSTMYSGHMVYSDTAVTINSLNATLPYYFTIEAFNESGITKSGIAVRVE